MTLRHTLVALPAAALLLTACSGGGTTAGGSSSAPAAASSSSSAMPSSSSAAPSDGAASTSAPSPTTSAPATGSSSTAAAGLTTEKLASVVATVPAADGGRFRVPPAAELTQQGAQLAASRARLVETARSQGGSPQCLAAVQKTQDLAASGRLAADVSSTPTAALTVLMVTAATTPDVAREFLTDTRANVQACSTMTTNAPTGKGSVTQKAEDARVPGADIAQIITATVAAGGLTRQSVVGQAAVGPVVIQVMRMKDDDKVKLAKDLESAVTAFAAAR